MTACGEDQARQHPAGRGNHAPGRTHESAHISARMRPGYSCPAYMHGKGRSGTAGRQAGTNQVHAYMQIRGSSATVQRGTTTAGEYTATVTAGDSSTQHRYIYTSGHAGIQGGSMGDKAGTDQGQETICHCAACAAACGDPFAALR